eukprot:Transcript_2885.p4 GENE.Transcript_2885~~Transcript_2885.p4  ORF type:complete len:91 (-),score=10.42 Transcript_2885:66-338(-)
MSEVRSRQAAFEQESPQEAVPGPSQPPPHSCAICTEPGADTYPELRDARPCGQYCSPDAPREACQHWYHRHCLIDRIRTHGPVCVVGQQV